MAKTSEKKSKSNWFTSDTIHVLAAVLIGISCDRLLLALGVLVFGWFVKAAIHEAIAKHLAEKSVDNATLIRDARDQGVLTSHL